MELLAQNLIDKVNISYNLVKASTDLCCIQGAIPDFVLRPVIRALCRQRLREVDRGSFELNHAAKMAFIEDLCENQPIAEKTEKANDQHYEVIFHRAHHGAVP